MKIYKLTLLLLISIQLIACSPVAEKKVPEPLEAKYGNSTYLIEAAVDDWHFKIYEVNDEKLEVFDLSKDNVQEEMLFQKIPNRMLVSDQDGDGVEEIYLFFEDDLGSSWLLLLNQSIATKENEKIFQTAYFGLSESMPEYIDINKNGKVALLTDYPESGDNTTVWEGLKLAYSYHPDTRAYAYSHEITRKYYEDAQAIAEEKLILNPIEENYVILLKNLAHQGKVSACKKIIEAIDSTELILEPEWQGPYDNYGEYVIAQASYYADIWLEIKNRDVYQEEALITTVDESPSVEPLDKADLELGNGLFLGMTYDTYCDHFAYNGTLEFNIGENGNSTGQGQLNMGTIELIFEWSPENQSSPLLIEYAVKDEFLKTKRAIGIGDKMDSVIEAYGVPDILETDALRYVIGDLQLVFDLKDDCVIQYRIDNGTGLLGNRK